MNNGNTSYDKLLTMWRDEKKKREEVEGELTIIKGVGNNSPEMKSLQAQVEKLKKEIDRLNEELQLIEIIERDHQELNGKLRTELAAMKIANKKLEDKILEFTRPTKRRIDDL